MPPRLLVVLMEDDYGDPQRGTSPEFYSLLEPLQRLYPGTRHFDQLRRLRAIGKDAMNAELVALVEAERPDLALFSLYTDEIAPATVDALRRWTVTVSYLYDDVWQFAAARRWARHFDFVTTPDPRGVARFAASGTRNVICSPFCVNELVYVREDVPRTIDVSFVGLHHPWRAWVVDRLRAAGHTVEAFGHGWPSGRVPIRRVVEIVNRTKVNLNISNSSQWDPRFLVARPLALPRMLKHGKHREQVKTRHVEIPACGAFELTYDVVGLADLFHIGAEIETYRDVGELIEKTRYYLEHEDERERIARAGWERAHREHTSERRLPLLVSEALERAGPRPA